MNKKITLGAKQRVHDKWLYIVIALIALGIMGYAWWFFDSHHKVETISYSPTIEVAQNRYYTAQALLKDAETLQGEHGRAKLMDVFDDTASASHQMVILHDVTGSYQPYFEEMMHWVSQGGHLVVFNKNILPNDAEDESIGVINDYQKNQNPLLVHLGIYYVAHDQHAFDGLDKALNPAVTPLNMNGEMVMIQGVEYLEAMGQFFAHDFFVKYPNAKIIPYEIFDESSHKILSSINTTLTHGQKDKINEALKNNTQPNQQPILFNPNNSVFDVMIDKGRLTVLSSDQFFVNPAHFGEYDANQQVNTNVQPNDSNHDWQLLTQNQMTSLHGYQGGLLWADNGEFLQTLVQTRHVYLVPDVESTGFFTLLWRHLRWSLIGMVLMVVAYLLALPKRFGARAVYETDVSRNIFGFFGYVGQYLWASDGAKAIFTQNRHALIQTILAKEHIKEQSPTNIAKVVSDKTGLSYGMVYEALYGTWEREDEFVRISRGFVRVSSFYA